MFALLLALWAALAPGHDDALVARLADEEWAAREAAHAALKARGLAALGALRRGERNDDAEVRRRCREIHEDAVTAAVDSLRPVPMIDAVYFDRHRPVPGYHRDYCPAGHDWAQPYLDRVGRDGYAEGYRNYYLAGEMAVRDLIEAGVPPTLLRPVLAEMRTRDAVFLGTLPPRMAPAP